MPLRSIRLSRAVRSLSAFLVLAVAATAPITGGSAYAASLGTQRELSDDPRIDGERAVEAYTNLRLAEGQGGPGLIQEYIVAEGDTMRSVAERFHVDVPTILSANPALAANPDDLRVGSTLLVLPTVGVLATVAEGDTLVRLAERYGLDPREVAAYNNLDDAEHLAPGQRLVLPGARPDVVQAPPASTDQQAASVSASFRSLIAPFQPVWPARGQITTHFGDVGATSPRGHAGLDIAAPVGSPIAAASDGTVVQAGWDDGGYGNLVVIQHPGGIETWYGHLSAVQVAPGDVVRGGERIGAMGSTGYSTGSHLHFEVRVGGALQDPLTYLAG